MDIIIANDYRDWNVYIGSILPNNPCQFESRAMYNGSNGVAVCKNPGIDLFACQFMDDDSLTPVNVSCKSPYLANDTMLNDCFFMDNATEKKSASCIFTTVNDWVPFGIASSVLGLTHLFYFLVLLMNWEKFLKVYLYIFGHCCTNKFKNSKPSILLLSCLTLFLGFLFPILTKMICFWWFDITSSNINF